MFVRMLCEKQNQGISLVQYNTFNPQNSILGPFEKFSTKKKMEEG